MARIFWLSDSPFTVTGYATISKNILNGLSELGHECYYQAHNYIGQTLPPGVKFSDGTKLNFTLLGTGKEPYSKDLLIPRIRELKPDIFGILLDTFMVYPWYLQLDFAPAKTLFYYPSDGEGGLPMQCENILKKCSVPIAMSKFAQKQVLDNYKMQTHYIPHAIDTKIYYPLSKKKRAELRKKWNLEGKFVVGSVYRNQGRKMADRMFKTFALFAKDHPNAVLFLHSDPFDSASVFDSFELIKRLNIQNRVIFTGMKFFKGFDYKKMNEVYNLMDVFFLSTSGEGFGIPTVEAAACGVPSVVTDYTTTKELLLDNGQCGIPVPIVTELTGSWTVERGIMDIPKAAGALKTLYDDKKLREKFGKVGRAKVLKLYDWRVIIKEWDKLIRNITE